MATYTGSLEDSRELILFFRNEAAKIRTLRRLIITPELTSVRDVNGDAIDFPGLTYGSSVLERLLGELGIVFTPESLHNPKATSSGKKEFDISARWTWGHDRIL